MRPSACTPSRSRLSTPPGRLSSTRPSSSRCWLVPASSTPGEPGSSCSSSASSGSAPASALAPGPTPPTAAPGVGPTPGARRSARLVRPTAPKTPAIPEFEVMYLLRDSDDTAVDALRARLVELGDSVLVVGGDGEWNVHAHVDDAGAAVEAGIEAGRPHRVRITRLTDEHGHGTRGPRGDGAGTSAVVAPRSSRAPPGSVSRGSSRTPVRSWSALDLVGAPRPAASSTPSASSTRAVPRASSSCPTTATRSWPRPPPCVRWPTTASRPTSSTSARPCRASPPSPSSSRRRRRRPTCSPCRRRRRRPGTARSPWPTGRR